MSIPAASPSSPEGALPPGEHLATWDEIVARFGTNTHRRAQLAGLELALDELATAGATTLYLDGSFVTEKPVPGDYDGCYDMSIANFAMLDPVFQELSHPRDAMKSKYLGELFPAYFQADAMLTYRKFFQQKFGVPKGIVALDLRSW